MSQLTDIILKAGILSPASLAEIERWRLPLGDITPADELAPTPTPASICNANADAIESEGYVLTRETDLEAIPQYLHGMRSCVLHVVMDDGAEPEFEIQAAKVASGDWLLPWRSDSITDLIANGTTYLRVGGERVYFSQARDLFDGTRKAFMVCTPVPEEANDHAGS